MSLTRYPISRCQSLHVFTDFQNYARIAIACVSWESRPPTRFTPVYITVNLGSDTDGRILVLYEHAIIRYWRKFILSKFDTSEISIYQDLWSQNSNFGWLGNTRIAYLIQESLTSTICYSSYSIFTFLERMFFSYCHLHV